MEHHKHLTLFRGLLKDFYAGILILTLQELGILYRVNIAEEFILIYFEYNLEKIEKEVKQ